MNKLSLTADFFSNQEINAAIKVLKSGKYTMGELVKKFENKLAEWINIKNLIMVNSGSSANLLIIEALLRGKKKKLSIGDEVIVPALCWPTTIWPIIQLGLIPKFVDSNPLTLGIDIEKVKKIISKKTKAIFLIHVLGNAENMSPFIKLCEDHNLILIEDCCESLGAYNNNKHVGTFGIAGSLSHFYSHHLTTIEGGSVITNNNELADDLRSMRAHGWIRDRKDKKILKNKYQNLDSRFLFVTSGYNFRPLEIQAAIGLEQLKKIDDFLVKREINAKNITNLLSSVEWLSVIGKDKIIKQFNKKKREHSWMNIPIILDKKKPIDIIKVKRIFEDNNIETRPIIAGNILKHPVFKNKFRNTFNIANNILKNGFMIGCHPFIEENQLSLVKKTANELKRI
jgi:CDP-6-deoxy-D-xylo-4-hexulose-3-dehydrase